MDRDGGRCFRCGEPLRDGWYSCHHRKLKSGGGTDSLDNRIMLHGSGTTGCHGWVHAHPQLARESGWLVSRYAEPGEVPVLHWERGMVYLLADGRVETTEERARRLVPQPREATDDE
jgi:hypothetical protein